MRTDLQITYWCAVEFRIFESQNWSQLLILFCVEDLSIEDFNNTLSYLLSFLLWPWRPYPWQPEHGPARLPTPKLITATLEQVMQTVEILVLHLARVLPPVTQQWDHRLRLLRRAKTNRTQTVLTKGGGGGVPM